MNQAALDLFIRLYSGDKDWITIVDENWKTVWSTEPDVPADLREKLILPADSWENTTRPFTQGDTLYQCQVRCSREDGLRVLHFQPVVREILDFSVITSIVQAMLATCTALYENLDADCAKDQRPYLNALVGNILRIYRMMYIEMEIRKGKTDAWESATFSLQNVVQPIYEHTRSLMRQFADVRYACGEPMMFVRGDLKGCRSAILAALLLCIRNPEYSQTIDFSLHREEQKAVLTIRVTPEAEKRRDLEEQLRLFGGMLPEERLLEQYCSVFGASVEFTGEGDSVVCRMELALTDPDTVIAFQSSTSPVDSGYFDPIAVMLARVRYRDYF